MIKKRAISKLSSRAGETIAETLIALLVASLALVMLAGAISTAADLVRTGRDKMDEYYGQDAAMTARGTASGDSEKMRFTWEDGASTQDYPIEHYDNTAFGTNVVVAYSAK